MWGQPPSAVRRSKGDFLGAHHYVDAVAIILNVIAD
jgi:hypothetical protein